VVTISLGLAQIIEQTPPLGDHLQQAAPRRVVLPVNLEMLSQMLDPASQKCDLHVCAAGIFIMQLELLEIQHLVALSHNEGATLVAEWIFATGERGQSQSASHGAKNIVLL
jgi:hypothetical protein